MSWLVNALLGAGTVFLLLVGEYFAARLQAARTARKEGQQ